MLPPVSVVVIGLNEAKHLDDCFKAIIASNYSGEEIELIYVDSGSADQSVAIAREYTSSVYIESNLPTAARNRNRGLIESKYDIVHFIDGDIVIEPDYLRFAVEKLLEGNFQCVFGRLEERNTCGLGKILLHDYNNRKPGLIDSPGAGGTFLKRVLIDVNGWDERIPRGEETELGERFRGAGYKIWFLDNNMGIHNHGDINLIQFFKRQIAEGFSLGIISKIKANGSFFKTARKSLINNNIFHLVAFLILALSLSEWPIWVVIFLIILYAGFLFIKYRFIRGVKNTDSLKFYFLIGFFKIFVFFGYCRFCFHYFFMSSPEKNFFSRRMDIKDQSGYFK